MTPPQDHHLGQLQAIIDGSSDCIKVLDLDAHLLSMNDGGLDVMEIDDFSRCQNALWPTFWEGEARLQVERAIEAARHGETSTFEGPARTFAGTSRWWEVRVSPLRDEQGTVSQLLAVSRDITARKLVEARLLESEARLQERATTLQVQVGQNERALAAFVRFTTQVATSTDLEVLATAACEIIREAVGDALSGFYLAHGDTAYPLVFSSNTPPEVRALRQKGISIRSPLIAQALEYRKVMFAEHDEGRQQSVGYASALSITPYFLGGQPYAVFATGTARPAWTPQEQAIVESVGQGLGLALERAQQTHQLHERTAGLDAFVAFTEVAANTTDLTVLVRHAVEVLQTTLGEVSAAYYTQEQELWKARVWSADLTPEVVAVVTGGISATAPSFAKAVQTRHPVFVSGWQADTEEVSGTELYGAVAFYPCFVGEQVRGLLVLGTQRGRDWTPREQAVFRSVGRSLTLALERAELTAQLQQRTRQLEEDARAQQAFVAFTESIGAESDVQLLAQEAVSVVQAYLEDVSVVYYERDGDLWKGVVCSADISEEVTAHLRAGVPSDAATFAVVLQTGREVFEEGWDAEQNHLTGASEYGAAALLPLLVDGEPHSLFSVGKRYVRTWTEREQAIVRAVSRSLGLALERTKLARQLTQQRDALDLKSQELTAANAELEAFTYSASHDLRTPVRHVMGFAELAQLALKDAPNEKAHRHLEVVKQGAIRMTALIDGMLVLSQSGRQELAVQLIDLSELAIQARRDVGTEFERRPVRWMIGDLPQVWGDRGMLQQVMTNLLSNAVKYSSTRERSEIQVWAEENQAVWTIFVQDNGVGFDPRYAQRLFGIFQRLHNEREFKGTGVGLATVKRIVQKHGGQVNAESTLQGGATFSFTLPKR